MFLLGACEFISTAITKESGRFIKQISRKKLNKNGWGPLNSTSQLPAVNSSVHVSVCPEGYGRAMRIYRCRENE